MHALRFDHFGDPHVLHITDMPDPVAGDGEAVIAVKASSVNPSDLMNVAGQFAETSLPRTPGRDFAGIVIDGPRDWAGAEVWGTGGDVGFRHDGPHAEMFTIPAAALAHKPEHLSFEEASTVGVNFVTGWLGVVEAAHLSKGETIAVFGVSGGVGSAVAQIAHALGSEVIGMDRVPPADGTPAASIIEDFVASDGSPQDIGAQIKRLTGGSGADVVYDAVGGITTPAALASLARQGRLVVISAQHRPLQPGRRRGRVPGRGAPGTRPDSHLPLTGTWRAAAPATLTSSSSQQTTPCCPSQAAGPDYLREMTTPARTASPAISRG